MGLQRRINRAIDIGVASTPVSPFSPIYFSNHFISTRFFLSFYARVSILFIVQLFFRFFPRIFFFFFFHPAVIPVIAGCYIYRTSNVKKRDSRGNTYARDG